MSERTRTVLVKCRFVSSDGFPVNEHGEEFGRGWRKCIEWQKRRRGEKWLRDPRNRGQWKEVPQCAKKSA